MTNSSFPDKIRSLEPFSERFDAFKLAADGCDVLFATYPAGTKIELHTHATDNWGVIIKGEMVISIDSQISRFGPGDWYHVPALKEHAAWCDVTTEEIEFWFVQSAESVSK